MIYSGELPQDLYSTIMIQSLTIVYKTVPFIPSSLEGTKVMYKCKCLKIYHLNWKVQRLCTNISISE
ncbi:hypothetical protein C0J52_20774 [Blattella germanica]|nr:hypothetical protein C0J52_20774 [Blattella germanica]